MLAKLVVSLCSYLLCCFGLFVVIKLPLLSFTHQLEPNIHVSIPPGQGKAEKNL